MNIEFENRIPFRPFDKKFEEVLAENYLRPSIIWMLRQKGPVILSNIPQTSVEQDSCWWALALYLEIFIDCLAFEELFSLSERRILADESVHLSEVLLENQSKNGAWDEPKGVWDTSAACRSLLLVVQASKTYDYFNLSTELSKKIVYAVKSGMHWLIQIVHDWDSLRYPYGPEDLATVLRLLRTSRDTGIHIFPKVIDSKAKQVVDQKARNEKELVSIIVRKLIQMKTSEMAESSPFPASYWESPFSTAQIIRGLCDVLDMVPDNLKAESLESILGGIRYIEQRQQDARWGLPNTTSLVLECYIRGSAAISEHGNEIFEKAAPQSTIVFKALRWLVEQRAPDGSMVHSYWHTAFFTLMLQYVIKSKFGLLNYSVIELYDHVLWESQNSLADERQLIYNLTNQIVAANMHIGRYMRILNFFITLLRILILLVPIFAFYFLFQAFGWLRIGFNPIAVNILRPEFVISIIIAIAPTLYAFWIYSKKWLRQR